MPSRFPVKFQEAAGISGVLPEFGEVPSREQEEDDSRRRFVLFLIALASSTNFSPSLASYGKTKGKNNPYDEKRLMEQNRRIQRENKAPEDFLRFIREGFEVKVVALENYVRRDSGLIYKDFEVGAEDCPGWSTDIQNCQRRMIGFYSDVVCN